MIFLALAIVAVGLFLIEADCPICDGGKLPILTGIGIDKSKIRPCHSCGDGRVPLFWWAVYRVKHAP